MDDALVDVTQADIDAGQRLLDRQHDMLRRQGAKVADATVKPDGMIVQALAQARLAGVKEGLEMAAECAEAYSAVNFETAGDSVLLDPVLRGHGFSPENMAASEKHQIDGLVHSSYAHAGQHLATAIRSLGPRP